MCNIIARYVYGSRINVPDYIIKGDSTYFVVSDHLGSIRLVVNSVTGNVVQEINYDAYGRVLLNTYPEFQPFGFAGGLYDQHTNLSCFGARDYDPTVGRWTNKDPIRFSSNELNLYAYSKNDPINNIDLTGKDAIHIIYNFYMVDTGYGFRLPLGHAAVVTIDPETGATRYYEYGRYGIEYEKEFGEVLRRPIPDLEMACDGKPTEESLDNLYKFISKHYGRNSDVSATYYSNADHQRVISYAESIKNNPNREAYSILWNNCYTFAYNAINGALIK
ncbi:RHS repeat-associated core domain-containing protein [Bacteroidota bacterium]